MKNRILIRYVEDADEVLEEMEPTPNSCIYTNALRVLNCCFTSVQKRRYLLYISEDMT